VDQLGDLLSREAARKHDRFGAAVWAGGEQFKRPPAVGLGAAPAAFCWLLGVRGPQRRHDVLTQVERGERSKRTVNLAVDPSIRRPIPGHGVSGGTVIPILATKLEGAPRQGGRRWRECGHLDIDWYLPPSYLPRTNP
jgi:hypothetical protein